MSAVRIKAAALALGNTSLSMAAFDVAMLDDVLKLENAAYAFPWTRANFMDALAVGYLTCALWAPARCLRGYFVASLGVDAMHLLNVAVAPAYQRRGYGRALLAELYESSMRVGAPAIWLEVRESNVRARKLYKREGFVEAGRRRGYYPAVQGEREDAVLMTKILQEDDV